MPSLGRWIAGLFGLYGLAALGLGALLFAGAFYFATLGDTPHSGDVVGLPDSVMRAGGVVVCLGFGLPVTTVGALNVGACFAFLRKGNANLMAAACVVDALVLLLVTLLQVFYLFSWATRADLPILFGAPVLAGAHLWAMRLFLPGRGRGRVVRRGACARVAGKGS